jgi:hypothetical protein
MKWNKYNPDNGYYTESVISDIQPKNSTEIEISVPIEFAKFDGTEWIDGRTKEELLKEQESQLLQLNLEYTEKISKLVSKFVEKNIIDGTPIPKEIIDERERLKLEYNNLKKLLITIDLNDEQRTI